MTKIFCVFILITIFIIGVHILPSLKAEAQPYDSDLSRALVATISSEWGIGGPNITNPRLNPSDTVNVRTQSEVHPIIEEEEVEEEMVEDSFAELEVPLTNSSIQPPVRGTETNTSSLNGSGVGVTTVLPTPVIDDIPFISSNETSLEANDTLRNITFVSEPLDSIPTNTTFLVGEPSTASDRKIVFYTGNLYSARSLDDGENWQYIEPREDFPTCCDQDVIFDPKHGLFIWSRQSHKNDTTSENVLRLAVSKNTSTWATYDIKPAFLNPSWKGIWLDNPILALGDKFLYITANLYPINASENSLATAMIIRISLDDLSHFQPASFSFYASPKKFFFTPVQGASDTMYWATHISNEIMRIYEWKESDTWQTVSWKDVSIPSWSQLLQNNSECGVQPLGGGPRSGNWCGHADSRISAGWIIGDKLGFFWNAAGRTQTSLGTSFPYPYVNAAVFDLSNNTNYLGRPYIWNSKYPILYAHASPNRIGELGIMVYYGDGIRIKPSLSFAILDHNYLNESVPWNSKALVSSTHSPRVEIFREGGEVIFSYEWGDYIRVRPHYGSGFLWSASGYVLEGGSTDENVKPYYFKIR